jgi:glycerophosphoryl diester phosphodiesterase
MKNPLVLIVIVLLLLAGCVARKTEPTEEASPQPLLYDTPLIVAHRGTRSVAPENTLLAAQRAYELQAGQWELDVQETKDGELVVLHDPGLVRTSDAAKRFPLKFFWQVKNFTLAEVKELDAGSWYLKNDPFGEIANATVTSEDQLLIQNERFPTLREALELTKEVGWSVNVEIKDVSNTPGDADIVQKTVALIEEMDMVNQVLISSFKHDYLVQVKALNPEIKTAALVTEMEDPLKLLQDIGADAINPDYSKIKDLGIIKTIRDAGYDVYVWTINDEETMIRFINAGVSGIITDYPQRMTEVLEKYQ